MEEDGSKKAILMSWTEEGTLGRQTVGVQYRGIAHEKKEIPLISSG